MKRYIIALLPLLLVGSLALAEVEEEFTFASRDLTVTNLVGEVEVIQGSGDDFRVRVALRGEDADEGFVSFLTEEGRDGQLVIQFPLNEHDDYVYPPMGSNSKTTLHFHDGHSEDRSWLKKVFKGMVGHRVTVRGRGKGLEVWADVTIEVPTGRSLTVKQGVGAIGARQVTGDLDLDISSGGITVDDITGELRVDTGSGSVEITRQQGDLNVDTGSGSVEVQGCEGNKFSVDTGSGSVEVVGVVCDRLHVDTGSGKVRARNVSADRAKIDTGSGSVVLELDRMGTGTFVIDTGSGGIDLLLPSGASADIVADTGSGRIKNRIEDADVRRSARDELAMIVGDGDAKVRLDAGSGSISIRRR